MATPTYMDLYNAAIGDTTTRSRVMVAIAKYAAYVAGGNVANATTVRMKWATDSIAAIGPATDQLMWAVVGDPAYQSAGSAIADTDLQTALETAVASIYP